MQPDADGDHQRERPSRRRAARADRGLPLTEPSADQLERGVGGGGAEKEQRRSMERSGQQIRRLQRLARAVDDEEDQQADGEREHRVDARSSERPDHRKPEQPERDGNHADEQTDGGEQQQVPAAGRRRLERDRDLVRELRAGRRQDGDDVSFACDPWIGNVQRHRPQRRDQRPRIRGEMPVRIVHRDLRDGHPFRTLVEDVEANPVRRQNRAANGKILDRRRRGIAQLLRRIHANDQREHHREQDERHRSGQPGSSARAGSGGRQRVRFHGVPQPLRTSPSTRVRRIRSGARGT